MAELFDLKETEERVVLIAVSTGDGDDAEGSLKELAELVKTAGAVTVDKVIQNREKARIWARGRSRRSRIWSGSLTPPAWSATTS